MRVEALSWADSVDRKIGVQSHYFDMIYSADNKMPEFSIHTGQPIKVVQAEDIVDENNFTVSTAYKPDTAPDEYRVFIVPGWKWVSDVEAAVEYWSQNTNPIK